MITFFRRIGVIAFLALLSPMAFAQTTADIQVGGDLDKFYPVTFSDANWFEHYETVVHIGRSDVHMNSSWRGSLISSFKYHTTIYGHGSNFISADIRSSQLFIAGWVDATSQGGREIVVWLKGGGTTYRVHSEQTVTYAVYDGVQNPLPYVQQGGTTRNYLTQPEPYAISDIKYVNNNMNITNNLYVDANVGIGTLTPQEKLSVNGKIRAKEIKVEATGWPDYVFKPDYEKMSLQELDIYIKANGHLPEVPSAAHAEKEGIALGEINKVLLKKIEELTLHLIEKDKQLSEQMKKNKSYEERLLLLEKAIKEL